MTTFVPSITADDAAEQLREMLADDPTVYVVQRRVSASGMNRKLSLFVIGKSYGDDAAPVMRNITFLVAAVNGVKVHEVDGFNTLNVGGAGMDMHFATVYGLSRRLYAEHPAPAGADESRDAGYALTHRTL